MWDFKNANFEAYREAISTHDWEACFRNDDIEAATETWTESILFIAKAHIPNREVTVRPSDKPWYNNALRKLCRRKDRLHKLAKMLQTPEAWENFRHARNEYFHEVSEAKENFQGEKYKTLIKEDNSSKNWWTIIKSIQKGNDAYESIPPLEVGNDIITDDRDKATSFNSFFLEASAIDDDGIDVPDDEAFLDGGLEEILISKQDVLDQISILDKTKSYGPDGISPVLLKEGGEALVDSLCKLYNMSLRLSTFPTIWKKANVTPIHKKNAQNVRTNYRPVSLLSVVGKVLERIIFKYVFNYFRDNFILSVFQSGFLPGRSTVTQLLEVYHSFCKAVDEGKEIRVVFLDITKAFDRVWHRGLIYKLHRCGIRGGLLEWFVDYLSNRKQRVVINGQASGWSNIQAGVPQGSVLGPILFLLYIDDIVHTVQNCKIRLFADDTCLFIEVEDRLHTAQLVNDDLDAIAAWSNRWLVQFSPAKTKSLLISNRQDSYLNPQVQLMGNLVEEVESHTYLGVRISANLSWKLHINDVATKARKKLSLMQPLKMKVDRRSLEIMYGSFVLPSMEYAIAVWGGSYDVDLAKLERIHLDGKRLITGATARSITACIDRETVPETFQDHIDRASLTTMFKIIRGDAPSYLLDILEELNLPRHYQLRYSSNIRVPYCRLETYKKSFFPRTISLWNDLPREFKEVESVRSFKSCFKHDPDDFQVLYYYGDRWPSVHHARMRMGCSKLNHDLFYNLHVIDSPMCSCGTGHETAEHYFFFCPLWRDDRQSLFAAVENLMPLTCRNLLFGERSVDLDTNRVVFKAVHKFIIDTKRFV